jgi:hypothetical protein
VTGLDFEAIRRRARTGMVVTGLPATILEDVRATANVVPVLLDQLERERAALDEALATVREQTAEIGKLRADLIQCAGQLVGARLAGEHLSEELAEFRREAP